MEGYYTFQNRTTAIPLANPTIVLSSNVLPKEVSQAPVSNRHASQTMLLLIGVLVFVSLMVGILLWIVQYEIQKRSSVGLVYSLQLQT